MLTFDPSYFAKVFPQILEALPFTFWVVIVSSVLCLVSGIVVAVIRLSHVPVLTPICDVWLSFVRSMPFILLLFLIYFTLPFFLRLIGVNTDDLDKITYVYATLAFAYAPVISEVLRPAYESVDRGQHEAAAVFGIPPYKKVLRIIAPQAMITVLPPMVNQLIEIVKDTSLMYFIGLMDIMGRTNLLITINQGRGKLENYVAVAVIYWVIIIALEALMHHLEKQNSRMLARRA